MCLISYKPESQKAAKDLIVYKIVKPVSGENKVTSVYYDFVYELGQLYFKHDFGNPQPLWNIENYIYIWNGQGFHSYLNFRWVKKMLRYRRMPGEVIVECLIPKDSLVAYDMDRQEVVSSSIIITKLLKVA